mmetsp:Transcript_86602/g.253472  ORF Transcript_86602/g.253472 Transcript_86602/m.253472 type:complete len:400 (-) Transcript_86602:68-1267(-)
MSTSCSQVQWNLVSVVFRSRVQASLEQSLHQLLVAVCCSMVNKTSAPAVQVVQVGFVPPQLLHQRSLATKHCPVYGGAAVGVCLIDACTQLHQSQGHPCKPVLPLGRRQQGRPAPLVHGARRGRGGAASSLSQGLHHYPVACLCGDVQRVATPGILGSHGHAVRERLPHGADVPGQGRVQQGARALRRGGRGRLPGRLYAFQDVGGGVVAGQPRPPGGRAALPVLRGRARAELQQQLQQLHVAAARRPVQRSTTPALCRIHSCARIEELLGQRDAAVERSPVKGRPAELVCHVHACVPAGQQDVQNFCVASQCSLMQRRPPLRVPRPRHKAPGQERLHCGSVAFCRRSVEQQRILPSGRVQGSLALVPQLRAGVDAGAGGGGGSRQNAKQRHPCFHSAR